MAYCLQVGHWTVVGRITKSPCDPHKATFLYTNKLDIKLGIGDKEQPGNLKVMSQPTQKHTCREAGSRGGSFSGQKAAGIRRFASTIDLLSVYSRNVVSSKGERIKSTRSVDNSDFKEHLTPCELVFF